MHYCLKLARTNLFIMLLQHMRRISLQRKSLELTVALIKPDACSNPLVVKKIQDILIDNFYIIRTKFLRLSHGQAEQFYEIHKDKFFFNRLVSFMTRYPLYAMCITRVCEECIVDINALKDEIERMKNLEPKYPILLAEYKSNIQGGPIYAHILAEEDAIAKWRKYMGPTKSYRAQYEAPSSVRGQFGLTDTRNAVHGSDSVESANREISFFFPKFDVTMWHKKEEKDFLRNNVKFNIEHLEHHVIHSQGLIKS